jgi:hypothetical protein
MTPAGIGIEAARMEDRTRLLSNNQALADWRARFGYPQPASGRRDRVLARRMGGMGRRQKADTEIHLACHRCAFRWESIHDATRFLDVRAIDAIRKADYFTASVLFGRGKYRVEKAATVFDAERLAAT